MDIPSQLEELLEKDRALRSVVDSAIGDFGPWLDNSGQPFFPEYTIHNTEHVEYVLQTADALIHDNARDIMTPGDAAVLILSTILHDSAMHLSEDGFIALITSDDSGYAQVYGDKPWKALWEEFVGEARRFDGHKLKSLFGDTDPVKVPKLDPQEMTKRDRMLIGEFLRRHHAKLAHEIALYGVPGPSEKKLELKNTDLYLRDIAGLVARSHGEEIRSCEDYLKKKYDLREYKGIHAVFLMTLLRVADYLHITAERAPKQILRVKKLRSPISQGEWDAHHAINDIRHTHEDPVALYIDAKPAKVKTFLRVKRWLTDIQKELDMSWAVLGEVYGRYQPLDNLGLTIRRIRSNLDDSKSFAATVDYVPCHAAFEAADADLLKLLIGPLYNEDASIGARELIQNAVDAVRELWVFQKLNHEYRDVELFDQETDVAIMTIKKGDEYYFEISDKGVGMTVDVIRNYFLKAGASFRKSDAWKKSFEDEEGHSKVLRSGRFGVGVLAAFLMGDEIYVSTRHVTEKQGIEFTAELESDTVELKKIDRPIGTLIQIKISEKIVSQYHSQHYHLGYNLSREWYMLPSPSFSLDGKQYDKHNIMPIDGQDLPAGWHRIEHIDYSDIQWSYEAAPGLSCNGIKISQYPFRGDSLFSLGNLVEVNRPNISVFDPDGRLPLNLARTEIRHEALPFENELKEDVLKDFAAYLIYSAPQKHVMKTKILKLDFPNYIGKGRVPMYRSNYSFYIYTRDGVSIFSKWSLKELGIKTAWVVPCGSGHDIRKKCKVLFENVLLYRIGRHSILRDACYALFGDNYPVMMPIKGAHVLIPDITARDLNRPNRLRQDIRAGIRTVWQNKNGWTLWSYGNTIKPDQRFEDIANEWDISQCKNHFLGTAKLYLTTEEESVSADNCGNHVRMWRDIIESPVIPYDLEKRKEVLSDAYSRLKEYIDAHEEIAKKKTKGKKKEKIL